MAPRAGGDGPGGAPGFREILTRAQAGDREAMDEALAILRPSIEPTARRYADPARPAESTSDLVQQSCLRAWQKIGTFAGGEGDEETLKMFRAWMGQIVRRLGIQAYRTRAARNRPSPDPAGRPGASSDRPLAPADPISPQSGPSTLALSAERAGRIESALEGLSDPLDARIVRMHFFDGLGLKEITARLGIEFADVRRRYRSAMRRLQKQMKDPL